MKKIKFMAMLLMATMALGFTACSDDDDDAPSIEQINDKLEGDWFLVKVSGWAEEDGEKYSGTETWDFENRSEYGSEGGRPCWLYIINKGDNIFKFSYRGDWCSDLNDEFNLENNVIYSWTNESSDEVVGYGSYKITHLDDNELVIVVEETDEDDAYYATLTYKRVDE